MEATDRPMRTPDAAPQHACRQSELNSKYTFETFVIGSSNRIEIGSQVCQLGGVHQ
jgi:chromosomal replication initiation ATPase DnaA